MEMIKKCFNPKVLIGLGVVAVVILLISPKTFFAALPLLILAICPISMVVMMLMMNKSHGQQRHVSTNEKENPK